MPTPQEIEAAKKAAAKKAADEAARKKAADSQDDDEVDDDVDETDDDESGEGKSKKKDQETDPDDSELGFSEKQLAYIKKLRTENAKHRNESKTLTERFTKLESGLKGLFGADDANLTPEERLAKVQDEKKKLSEEKEQMAFNQTLAEAAIEYGVTKANLKYFKFLVAQAAEVLEDGEELTDDDIKKLAKEANGRSGAKGTSVDGGDTPPPDEDDSELSLEEFQAMGVVARSALFQKDKALYEKMLAKERGAKSKKK